jgi:hypothetical protein
MRIIHTGNVGIGTTNPGAKLVVVGNGEFTDTLVVSKGASDTIQAGSSLYLVGGSGASYTQLQQGVGRFIIFGFNGSSWIERFTINNTSGNVGIGTNDPGTYKLNVSGWLGAERIYPYNTNSTYLRGDSGGVTVSGTGYFYSDANGGSYFQGPVRFRSTISDDTNAYLTINGGTSGGRTYFNGNVGIGITNPSYTLQVNGTIVNQTNLNATGDPGLLITSGHRLGFDQSGTRSWNVKATSGNLAFNSGDGFGAFTFGTNVGIGMTNPVSVLDINYRDSNANIVRVSNGSGAYRWRIDQNFDMFMTNASFADTAGIKNNGEAFFTGNVGIGTATPFTPLHIARAAAVAPVIRLQTTDSTTNGAIQWTNSTNTQLALIGSNYNIGDGSGNLEFATGGGSTRMIINSGGNVGVNNTTPGATFVVGAQSSGQAGSGYESDNSILSRFGASNEGRRMIGLTITNTATATVGNDASLSFVVASNYSSTGIISTILQNTGTAYSDMTFSVYNGSGNPERMRINGVAGNVGIGNTNPSRKLDVLEGNVQIVANFQNTSTTSARIKFTDANTGAENVNIGATGTSLAMWTNNTVRMTILSGGNVGIGSNTPGTKLDVSGSIRGGSFPNSLTNSGEAWLGRAADRTLGTMTFQLGGSSATNTVFEIVDRAWTKVMYAFSGEAPSDSIRVNTSGNVGINTGTPTHKLHVNGTLRVDNAGSAPANTEPFDPGGVSGYYGKNQSYLLGDPNAWLAINVAGTPYVIPLYS